MPEESLEKYFESIDFLPLGEKIADLNRAIEATRRIRKGGNPEVQEELEFLKGIKQKELEKAATLLRKKLSEEIKKMDEMRSVFKEFNAKISNAQLSAIAYPDEIRIKEEKDIKLRPMFYFTAKGMKRWYGSNIAVRQPLRSAIQIMRPFKTHSHSAESFALAFRAFGIAGWEKSKGGQFYEVLYVQPLVFFRKDIEDRSEGRGLEQPLPKAHLLMVFLLLKKAKEEKTRILQFQIPPKKGTMEDLAMTGNIKDIYREIASIATEYYKHYKIAQFIKKN